MSELVKCERCLEIKPLGRYTKFEKKEVLVQLKERGTNGSTVVRAIRKDIGEKRGLCKDCSREVAKMEYDKSLLVPLTR